MDLVERTRAALGPVGAFVGLTPSGPSVRVQQAGISRLESVGWRAVWTNEIVGTDALIRSALWLAATRQLVVGTCIANVWARPAQTAHAAATDLAAAFPDRFVLGVGVGNPGQAAAVGHGFDSPVATARAYLERLTPAGYPRLLAANGPRLLALAADLTANLADGALPAGRPPSATAQTRSALGPAKLLVVYAGMTRSEDAAALTRRVRAHLDAGADHVILGLPYDTDFSLAVDHLASLGPVGG